MYVTFSHSHPAFLRESVTLPLLLCILSMLPTSHCHIQTPFPCRLFLSLCLSPSLDHVTFLLPPPSFIGHCFFSYFFYRSNPGMPGSCHLHSPLQLSHGFSRACASTHVHTHLQIHTLACLPHFQSTDRPFAQMPPFCRRRCRCCCWDGYSPALYPTPTLLLLLSAFFFFLLLLVATSGFLPKPTSTLCLVSTTLNFPF